jgi:hypothetical protein
LYQGIQYKKVCKLDVPAEHSPLICRFLEVRDKKTGLIWNQRSKAWPIGDSL